MTVLSSRSQELRTVSSMVSRWPEARIRLLHKSEEWRGGGCVYLCPGALCVCVYMPVCVHVCVGGGGHVCVYVCERERH